MRVPSLAVCTLAVLAVQDFNHHASAAEDSSLEPNVNQLSVSNRVVGTDVIVAVTPPETLDTERTQLSDATPSIAPEVVSPEASLVYSPPV